MAVVGRDIAHWTVAFYGRPRNWLEELIFSPGFRHCIAFAWIDHDRWLMIDPGMHRQRMVILTGPQYRKRLQALRRIRAHIVKASGCGGARQMPRIATCAGTIAHVMGVEGALRPEGLYRVLARNQAARGQRENHSEKHQLHAAKQYDRIRSW